jgi:hypothetical protein
MNYVHEQDIHSHSVHQNVCQIFSVFRRVLLHRCSDGYVTFLYSFLSTGLDWVHLARWPLFGELYQPQMMDDDVCGAARGMSGWGKPKYSQKACPSVNMSTTNPILTDPGSNQGLRIQICEACRCFVQLSVVYILQTDLINNSVAVVRERPIPADRPPPVGEVSANSLRIDGATWSEWRFLTAVFSVF